MSFLPKDQRIWGFLFGGLGGAAAWAVAEPVMHFCDVSLASAGLPEIVARKAPAIGFATIVGLYLGFFLGAIEGLLTGNARLFNRGVFLGGLAGIFGGLLGSLLGEFLLEYAGAGQLPRAIGWGVFGALLGLAPGLVSGDGGRAKRGLIGGALGGVLGGLLFGLVHAKSGVNFYARAFGLPLLGATLGLSYALVEQMLRRVWLTVMSGKSEGFELPLGDREVTIGGGNRADLRLVSNQPIPQLAARIVSYPEGYRVEKLDIDFIEVNDKQYDSQPLKDGDVIRVRNVRILFRQKLVKGSADIDVPAPTTQMPVAAPVPEVTGPRRCLVCKEGSLAGETFNLDREVIRVGREDDNDIVIDEGSVSLHHAEIIRRGKWTVVVDRGSTNGTFVSGRRVQENALKHGFEIKFGQVVFEYVEEEAGVKPRARAR